MKCPILANVNDDGNEERSICLGDVEILAPRDVVESLESLGGIDSLKSKLPSDRKIEEMANFHKALSDPIRMRIMWSLSISDLCPCVIKELLDISDSKLSYHLSILESNDQISSRKEKNWRIYSITDIGRSAIGI